jgi:hypothetical protein
MAIILSISSPPGGFYLCLEKAYNASANQLDTTLLLDGWAVGSLMKNLSAQHSCPGCHPA